MADINITKFSFTYDTSQMVVNYTVNTSLTYYNAYVHFFFPEDDTEIYSRFLSVSDLNSGVYITTANSFFNKIYSRMNTTTTKEIGVRIRYSHSGAAGWFYSNDVTTTMTLINHEPFISGSVSLLSSDTETQRLSGSTDGNTIIKNVSDVSFSINTIAKKGASVEYFTIRNGETFFDDFTGRSVEIEDIESNTFYLSVTDSRGTTTNNFKTITTWDPKSSVTPSGMIFVPYINLTARIEVGELTSNGNLPIKVKGKFFNHKFGVNSNAVKNDLEIDYAIEDDSGNWIFGDGLDTSGWVNLGVVSEGGYNFTVDDDNNYTFTYTITGIPVEQYDVNKFVLHIAAYDQVNTTGVITEKVIINGPLFDWSKSDFRHHTDVEITNEKDLILKGNTLTDFVIEEASNGTWYYRKWNNGRIELHGYQNISSMACNTALGGWFRSAVIDSPDFPVSVINPKCVSTYESDGQGALIWNTTKTSESSPPNYYLIRPTSSNSITGVVYFYVTGTWE